MFGELLGLRAASVWKEIGSPPLLRLIELGPGRGTMLADALRALRVLPPRYQSLSIHLIEINPVRDKQKSTLSGVRNIACHDCPQLRNRSRAAERRVENRRPSMLRSRRARQRDYPRASPRVIRSRSSCEGRVLARPACGDLRKRLVICCALF